MLQGLRPDLACVPVPGRGEYRGWRIWDEFLPSCGVILGPDTHVLIQVVGTQDGGVSGEVLEVVHDDGDKEIQHLWGSRGPRESGGRDRGNEGVSENDTDRQTDRPKDMYTETQMERGIERRWGKEMRQTDRDRGTER